LLTHVTSEDGPSAGPGVETRDDAPRTEPTGSDSGREGSEEALALVLDELRRVQEQLEQLVRIRVDRLKIQWRDRLLLVAWGMLGVVVLAAATVAAVLYTMDGLSGLIAASLGRPWLGDLIVGASVLVVLSCALGLGGLVLRRRGLAKLRRSYGNTSTSAEGKEEPGP
jgi:hypothetical protein